MSGKFKTTGVEPATIVLDEVSLTSRPEFVMSMSLRVRLCGPDHREADGDSRLEALRKAKKPRVKAAFIVGPSVA